MTKPVNTSGDSSLFSLAATFTPLTFLASLNGSGAFRCQKGEEVRLRGVSVEKVDRLRVAPDPL